MVEKAVDLTKLVRQAAQSKGMSLVDVAGAIGVSPDTLHNVLRGRSTKQSAPVLESIRRLFGLPRGWPEVITPIVPIPMVAVRVVGVASSGEGRTDELEDEIFAPANMVTPGCLGMVNQGDSNMPLIQPGDVLIAEPDKFPRVGKLMFVRRENQGVSAKFVSYSGGAFTLNSVNATYPAEPALCEWLGVVTGLYRQEGQRQLMLVDANGLSRDSFGWHPGTGL